MTARNLNFYNLNSTRSYPLADDATGTADDSRRLPNDIIVDCALRFPVEAGKYAYIGGVTVTARLVTVLIMASDDLDAEGSFVPLASITLQKPVKPFVHYPLAARYPGVGGFIVFQNTDVPFAGRFSSPRQGLLLPKCARHDHNLPIPNMRKLGRDIGLTDLITLRAGTDIEIVRETLTIDDVDQEAIVIRLTDVPGRNVLAEYIGPCGHRPESNNCDKQGIQTINEAVPDCDGNITIVFEGMQSAPFEDDGNGVTLDQVVGIDDVCAAQALIHVTPQDTCGDTGSDSVDVPSDSDTSSISEFVSSTSTACGALPWCENFDLETAEFFVVKSGIFVFETADSPEESCDAAVENFSESIISSIWTEDVSASSCSIVSESASSLSDQISSLSSYDFSSLSSSESSCFSVEGCGFEDPAEWSQHTAGTLAERNWNDTTSAQPSTGLFLGPVPFSETYNFALLFGGMPVRDGDRINSMVVNLQSVFESLTPLTVRIRAVANYLLGGLDSLTGAEISTLPTTAAYVDWDVPTTPLTLTTTTTPDLSAIMEEVMTSPDWAGNALVLLFEYQAGTADRAFLSWCMTGLESLSPELVIDYELAIPCDDTLPDSSLSSVSLPPNSVRIFTGFECGNFDDWADGNEAVTNSTVIGGAGVHTIQSDIVRSGDYALLIDCYGTEPAWARLNVADFEFDNEGDNHFAAFVRFYFRCDLLPVTGTEPIFYTEGTYGGDDLELRIGADGILQLWHIDNNMGIFVHRDTGTTALAMGSWYCIELETHRGEPDAGTAFPYEVRLNSTLEMAGDHERIAIPADNPFAAFVFGKHINRSGQSVTLYYDDILVDAEQFPGPGRCLRLVPDGELGKSDIAFGSWEDMIETPANAAAYVSTQNGTAASYAATMQDATTAGISGVINACNFVWLFRSTDMHRFVRRVVTEGNDIAEVVEIEDVNTWASTNWRMQYEPVMSRPWTPEGLDDVAMDFSRGADTGHCDVDAMYLMVDFREVHIDHNPTYYCYAWYDSFSVSHLRKYTETTTVEVDSGTTSLVCHATVSVVDHLSTRSVQVPFIDHPDISYAAFDGSTRNLSVWDACAYDSSLTKRVSTDLQLRSGGGFTKLNGGIIVNYHTVTPLTNPHTEYFLILLDRDSNALRVMFYTGTSLVEKLSVALGSALVVDDWYRLTVDVRVFSGSQIVMTVTARSISNPAWPVVSTSFLTSQFMPADGLYGLGTDRAHTRFSYFHLQDLP